MDAKVFMSQSFHSSAYARKPEPEYSGPKVGERSSVDRWDAERNCWYQVELVWDGVAYVRANQ